MLHLAPPIEKILSNVFDPEVPVLSILDLGIVRKVFNPSAEKIEVTITPTYSGCPAMQTIATLIRLECLANGFTDVVVKEQLSPAWTTDWMSEEGKEKLRAYGIAPPQYQTKNNPNRSELAIVPCPICASTETEMLSEFGSTACKSLYRCKSCLEPFDYFKCH